MPQAGELQVIKERQQPFINTLLQDALTGSDRESAIGVEAKMPADMRELKRLMQQIDDVQQPLALRFDEQAGMPARVPFEVDDCDTRRDFITGADEAEAVLQRSETFEVALVRRAAEGLPARRPFVPFGLRGDIASFGVGERTIGVGEANDVVSVEIGQVNDVDIGRGQARAFPDRADAPPIPGGPA